MHVIQRRRHDFHISGYRHEICIPRPSGHYMYVYMARETALLQYGRLAHGHHLAFHRNWIEGGKDGEEILGSADPSSASDLNATVQTVHEMRTFPVDRPAVIQLLVSAALPMLVAAALQMPIVELMKLILGVLL